MKPLAIEFYKSPDTFKTLIGSKRGYEYQETSFRPIRRDKNRRRADWYFERIFNNCLSQWEWIEVIPAGTTYRMLKCHDKGASNCRCVERQFLNALLGYIVTFHRKRNSYPSYIRLVRAWLIAEGALRGDNNLSIIERLDDLELIGEDTNEN